MIRTDSGQQKVGVEDILAVGQRLDDRSYIVWVTREKYDQLMRDPGFRIGNRGPDRVLPR